MKTTKLLFALTLLILALLSTVGTPEPAWACSGDDCGCGTDAQECVAACEPGETYSSCTMSCRRANLACARACCGGW